MTLLDLAHQAGLNPKWVAGTGGGEYHSPCPACGGRDRFFIQPHKQMRNCQGTYRCRQCGINGDAIKFAQDIMKLSFKEAVGAVGVEIPDSQCVLFQKKRPVFVRPQAPPIVWQNAAQALIIRAHRNLLSRAKSLAEFERRGLTLEAITTHTLGWINENEFHLKKTWGIDALQDAKRLWIPQGLLIPSIEKNGAVMRLKVRRQNISPDDDLPRYVAISGSMNGMLRLGSLESKTVIVVESELDAYALRTKIDDEQVTIVAVGGSLKQPDLFINKLAKQADALLICRDNDAAGAKMFSKWRALYSHARDLPTPQGKDIGEAIVQGFDVKTWLLEAIHAF